jgi:long-chain acyl-CoA synthetase
VVPIAVELVPEEKVRICREIRLDSIVSSSGSSKVFEGLHEENGCTLPDDVVFILVKSRREHPPGFSDLNAAFVRFTSGTTSASKGVILSHETVYDRIHAANDVLRIGGGDTVVWLLSMSYHFTVSIVSYLSFGATIVVCRDHFGSTIINTAADSRATLIYGSPVHYNAMVKSRSLRLLPDLRIAISTATQLRIETAEVFLSRFGLQLSEAYGIIEVGLPCINLHSPVEKAGSVGRPLPAYEIRMMDVGLGTDLKVIEFRGKGFLDAYYDPWKTREEIMPSGWFATGDLGKLDEEGYLTILGRSKEMISVAGMKFFPQETEAILESHPSVREAYVFPQASDRFGEVPHAQVVLVEGIDKPAACSDLKNYCKRQLSFFKIPERIEFTDRLPRTASGKLIRQRSEAAQ